MHKTSLKKNSTDGILVVQGDLTLENVGDLWSKSKVLLDQTPSPVRFQLQDVQQSDSAGIALLIAWMRYLKKQGKETQLLQPSEQMQALAKVSGLTNILPFI